MTVVIPFRLKPVLEVYATTLQAAGYSLHMKPMTREEAIADINAATSPEQRRARKSLHHALLYGSGPLPLQRLIRNRP